MGVEIMAGRKNKWEELNMDSNLILIEAWCRDGAIDKDIMNKLGISSSLFYRWKIEKSEFMESLKKGKEIVDIEVENALYKKAIGYSYEEVTKEPLYNKLGAAILDDKGKHMIAVTKVVTKQMAGDTTAQIFWLKNRKSLEWREKKEVELNATLNKKLEDYLD